MAHRWVGHDNYRVSQKKVSDKIFPRRLPNGRGLRTNFQLNCEASLKTWSFPQKSSRQTSGKRPGVRRQSLRLVRSPGPLGSRRGRSFHPLRRLATKTLLSDKLMVGSSCLKAAILGGFSSTVTFCSSSVFVCLQNNKLGSPWSSLIAVVVVSNDGLVVVSEHCPSTKSPKSHTCILKSC